MSSKRKRAKDKSINKGMMPIFDMFKKNSEGLNKQKLSFVNKHECESENSVNWSLNSESIDNDSDIEIIEADDLSISCNKLSTIQCDEPDGINQGTGQVATIMKGKCEDDDLIGKPQSRLSLKRKRVSKDETITKPNLKPDKRKSDESSKKGQKESGSTSVSFGSTDKDDDSDRGSKESIESVQVQDQPYYQRNFETILNSVTNDAYISTLFSDGDQNVINAFRSLSEQAKRLYIRLFGRKFKWIPFSKIKYSEIAQDLTPCLKDMTNSQLLYGDDNLTDLKDVLETLTAGDIKTMAKLYHVASSITQKKQIIKELIKLSKKSNLSSMFGSKGGIGVAMLKKAKALVCGAYKLQQEPRSVFIRIMMLFSLLSTTGDEDSGNGGQGQLFQMLMVNMGKVVYPTYKIEKKNGVFKAREDVIRFEEALQLESDLLRCTEKGDWSQAYDVYCSVSKVLEKLQEDEEIEVWNENLPDFLRCFSATSVLYRLLSQGIEILQRRKEYNEAVILIRKLLDQHLYCCSHRGYWWERLALNLDVHLKQPIEALEAVASGLDDNHVIGGHRLALYQRAESICERPKLKLKDRLARFYHSPIKELPKVYLEGRTLHQGVTSSGPRFLTEGSYVNGNAQDMTVCGVEEFVMEHYKRNGYPQGIHAEGSIVTSLFGLFFWDILFMSVPDAFHSLYQTQPLDLYSSTSFYSSRKVAIDDRLAEIESSSCEALNRMIEETWTNELGKVCACVNWDRLQSVDHVKGLVGCMGGKALSGILERYAKCPRHTRSGFPDLTLWNVQTKAWKISEVKGPGDKLSHKQILWLDYLVGLGVDAEVCHVKAVAAKKLRLST